MHGIKILMYAVSTVNRMSILYILIYYACLANTSYISILLSLMKVILMEQ